MNTRLTARRLASGLLLLSALVGTVRISAATDPRETPPPPPAIPDESTIRCPLEDGIAISGSIANGTSYRKGFLYGCNFLDNDVFYAKVAPFGTGQPRLYATVFDFLNDQSGAKWADICSGERAAGLGFAASKSSWVDGCFFGLSSGVKVFDHNIAGHTPLTITTATVKQICEQRAKSTTWNPKTEWESGCAKGYYLWVNRSLDGTPQEQKEFALNQQCIGGTVAFNNGCSAGWQQADKDYIDTLPVTPGPSAAVLSFVNDPNVKRCGVSQGIIDGFGALAGIYGGAHDQGCYNGFFRGFNNNPGPQCELSYPETPTPRGTKQRAYTRGFLDGCASGYQTGLAQRNKCVINNRIPNADTPFACAPADAPRDTNDQGNNSGSGIVPKCNPSLPPSDPNGCGINKAVELIKNIMSYLFLIALPIAAFAIGWGGFQIMTAAGSTEKVSAGISAMKLAVIGIVIMLASYFVVQLIFKILGVSSSFTPGGL